MPKLPSAKNTPIGSEDFVAQMFKNIDKDGNGKVSKAEILEYGQKYGAALLGAKGQKLFAMIDSSGDDQVSIDGNSFIHYSKYQN